MPRPTRNLSDKEIDEISTVDKTANQYSRFVIAKRAPEEDEMPQIYNQEGQPLDENDLDFGDVVFDDEGNAYEYVEDSEEEYEEEPELQEVGKSAFFANPQPQGSFSKAVMEELSKAFSDKDRDAVLSKAFEQFDYLEQRQAQYEEIAKAERDLRLTREYISKAAEYNLPVAPDELGPVLCRMAETMDYDDCAVIAKCLETAGAILYEEVGFQGGGDNADVYSQVEAAAYDTFGKAEDFSEPAAINKMFDMNPDAYDEYLLSQRNR